MIVNLIQQIWKQNVNGYSKLQKNINKNFIHRYYLAEIFDVNLS